MVRCDNVSSVNSFVLESGVRIEGAVTEDVNVGREYIAAWADVVHSN